MRTRLQNYCAFMGTDIAPAPATTAPISSPQNAVVPRGTMNKPAVHPAATSSSRVMMTLAGVMVGGGSLTST